MDQRMQHSFVNKPFYKSYRKCTGCRKRNIFRRIAKCSGCKIYCHQRCMQSDDNACCSPNHVEPKAQVTVPDLKTTVSWSSENYQDLNVLLWPEDDNQDLCQAESYVVADRPDNNSDVSCTDSTERRPCTPDDDDPGTGVGIQDENFEAINDHQLLPDVELYAKDVTPSDEGMPADDECGTALDKDELQADEALLTPSDDDGTPADECGTALANEEVLADENMSTPSDDGPPADECGTALANEEVLADENMSTPSDDGPPADECGMALANDEVHTKSIQGFCAFKLASHHLSCTETEVAENQNDDDGDQKNKCCYSSTEMDKRGDDGDRKEDVPGKNKLD